MRFTVRHIRQVIALTGLGVCLFGASALPSEAHYVAVRYSWNSSCGHTTDPVTFIYEGSGATLGRSVADVVHHTKWATIDPDSFLGIAFYQSYFNGHDGACHRQGATRAQRSGLLNDRYHTRFFGSPDRDSRGNWHIFLTPHKEQWVARPGCGPLGLGNHAVEPGHSDPNNKNQYYESNYYSGFDHGRDQLLHHVVSGKNPHHSVGFRQWTNTRSFRQCNGWWSGSSGAVYSVTLGRGG